MTLVTNAQKQIALTFDCLPTQSSYKISKQEQIRYFNNTLAVLDYHGIKVMGFAVGSEVDKFEVALLSKFITKGHLIGNNTENFESIKNYEIKVVSVLC